MTTLAIQWIMPSDNGNPADAVMNTWHFKTNDVGTPNEEASDCVAEVLVPFYENIHTYLSSFLAGNYVIKAFDLADPEPRVPVLETGGSLSAVGSTSGLPCEVAVCLSFQAERLSGHPQARRRGRLYIGPLAIGADPIVADGTAADMIVGSTFRSALATQASAAAGVFIGTGSGSSMAWCTFSPTDVAEGKTLAQASNNVTDGWIDFAVDIQRRRGHAPGGRTLWVD